MKILAATLSVITVDQVNAEVKKWLASAKHPRWNRPYQRTVPVGGGVGRLFKIGPLPVNTQLQGFYNADRPKDSADWQLRFQLQFLFPK